MSEYAKRCDNNIRSTILLAEQMIRLADKGDIEREDVGCGILYGILRDSGYKIKRLAESERDAHIKKGWWRERGSDEADNSSLDKINDMY